MNFNVTTNVPDFNHHKGAKTRRTPSISKLFLFFVPLWLRVFVVSSRATLVVTFQLSKREEVIKAPRHEEKSVASVVAIFAIGGDTQLLNLLEAVGMAAVPLPIGFDDFAQAVLRLPAQNISGPRVVGPDAHRVARAARAHLNLKVQT